MKIGRSTYLNILYAVSFLVFAFIFDWLGWGSYIWAVAVVIGSIRAAMFLILKI